jgi:hypothetical protein
VISSHWGCEAMWVQAATVGVSGAGSQRKGFSMSRVLIVGLMSIQSSVSFADAICCGSRSMLIGDSSAELAALCGERSQVERSVGSPGGSVRAGVRSNVGPDVWSPSNSGPITSAPIYSCNVLASRIGTSYGLTHWVTDTISLGLCAAHATRRARVASIGGWLRLLRLLPSYRSTTTPKFRTLTLPSRGKPKVARGLPQIVGLEKSIANKRPTESAAGRLAAHLFYRLHR